MGQEFGQLREWSEERGTDWYLLGEENHKDLQSFVKTLLHMYKNIRRCIKRTMIRKALSGSMQMTETEVFSALCQISYKEEQSFICG